MNARWYMVLDEASNTWSWCLMQAHVPVETSKPFVRFVDAVADAETKGCTGTPAFARLALADKLRSEPMSCAPNRMLGG
jgi:hypothetical protein